MTKNSFVIDRKNSLPILGDVTYIKENKRAPLVLFCHGYKGYKDWGAWNVVAKELASKGNFVCKFNFSHNGGTIGNPIDFSDLDAFAENNYTKELDDLGDVVDWLFQNDNQYQDYFDNTDLTLIGHSRGGGIVILKASEDVRITKLITLAAVSDFKARFPKGEELEQWRIDGVRYVLNGRTKQQMPHYYQFYINFIENESRLDISKAAKSIKIPFTIIHGDNDEAVNVSEAHKLKELNPLAQLKIIKGGNHTFGSYHPYEKEDLPRDLNNCLEVI